MKIWRTQVGSDVFTEGELLPEAYQPPEGGLVARGIFVRGTMVEREREVERQKQDEDGDYLVDKDDNPVMETRTVYEIEETPIPGKVIVFALPREPLKDGTGAGAWHPSTGFAKGLGRGAHLELTYVTEDVIRVPFLMRVATYNDVLASLKGALKAQGDAIAAVRAAVKADEDDAPAPLNGSGVKPAEGSA